MEWYGTEDNEIETSGSDVNSILDLILFYCSSTLPPIISPSLPFDKTAITSTHSSEVVIMLLNIRDERTSQDVLNTLESTKLHHLDGLGECQHVQVTSV